MKKMLLLAMVLGTAACDRSAPVAATQESDAASATKAWKRVGELEVENAGLRKQIEDLQRQVPAATETASETVAEFATFVRPKLTLENGLYNWPFITTAKLGSFGWLYNGRPAPSVVYVVSPGEMLIQFSAISGPAMLWVHGIPTAGLVEGSAVPVEHYLFHVTGTRLYQDNSGTRHTVFAAEAFAEGDVTGKLGPQK